MRVTEKHFIALNSVRSIHICNGICQHGADGVELRRSRDNFLTLTVGDTVVLCGA